MSDRPAPSMLVEAVLLVSPRPVGPDALAAATGLEESEVREAIADLENRYSLENSGIVLRGAAGGYQLATNPACADTVERFREELRPAPLSGAAYEVLSCALYFGPTTRAQVSAVRGVNSDAVVRSLLERGLLAEAGSDKDSPGAPTLLDVSREFLAAAGAGGREEFPDLDTLVGAEEISRVKERVEKAREGPAIPEDAAESPEDSTP